MLELPGMALISRIRAAEIRSIDLCARSGIVSKQSGNAH
jgi:hypothetical protein